MFAPTQYSNILAEGDSTQCLPMGGTLEATKLNIRGCIKHFLAQINSKVCKQTVGADTAQEDRALPARALEREDKTPDGEWLLKLAAG